MARASMQIIPSVKMNKPTIRLIHSLGRSGATVARKCLGVMEGVVLLSEINPKGLGSIARCFKPMNGSG